MRPRSLPPVEAILLVGGRLCLDFVNTANRLDGDLCDERFAHYDDLLRWSERLGLLEPSGVSRLQRQAQQFPGKASRALEQARALRECLARVFVSGPRRKDLSLLEHWARSRPVLRLSSARVGAVAIEPGKDLGDWLLRAVSASAIELLTSPVRTHVHRCPGARCGWLFLDESPGRRRKWCSMRTCGNRHKARQHYASNASHS